MMNLAISAGIPFVPVSLLCKPTIQIVFPYLDVLRFKFWNYSSVLLFLRVLVILCFIIFLLIKIQNLLLFKAKVKIYWTWNLFLTKHFNLSSVSYYITVYFSCRSWSFNVLWVSHKIINICYYPFILFCDSTQSCTKQRVHSWPCRLTRPCT